MDSINEYITTFNELMDKLSYECTSNNITKKFKARLLKTLLEKILDRDIWLKTLDEWQNAAQHESHHSYRTKVFVPEDLDLQHDLLKVYHDTISAGHPGVTLTLTSLE